MVTLDSLLMQHILGPRPHFILKSFVGDATLTYRLPASHKSFIMKAVVIQAPKKAELVTERPEPKLRHDYVKVKTVAVALNPTGILLDFAHGWRPSAKRVYRLETRGLSCEPWSAVRMRLFRYSRRGRGERHKLMEGWGQYIWDSTRWQW